ncbi:MAG: L,D-transpeptidase family protein, partial [Flavobacteriaceae bacterium]|nr:L,D-transpeptidase family protein [Flavobacteriaceae bacterium]
DYLLDLQPQHEGYKNTQNALRVFLKKASLSKKIIKVINYKEDSLKAYKQAKKSLVNHRYILKKSSDSVFINGLKKFQTDHGLTSDGVVGKNTAMALSISPFEYYQNAAISLERWRWKKVWKPTFIYVNIPAYFIKYYKNDTLQFRSNVVVGTVRNKTPEVYGKLNHLVAYPYWNVPTSISVNEILVNAKKDTSYMERNNYEVFSNKFKEISLDSIKWDTIHKKNFHYYIRQRGGTSNALGLVKFIFNNKYSIYLHDTPTKYYFYRDIRAYSHGCIRVQKALQLADTLLISDKNKFTLDSVFAYIDKKEEKKMIFTKKLPLYIQYITCTSDKNNRLIFYKDIYGYDEKVRKILFK